MEPPEPVDTTPRDKDGYPLTARRKLKRVGDDVFEDIDTGQRFRAQKGEDGTRLVPVFSGRVTWKTMQGYKAAQLLVSCMGAEGEYQLWSKEKDAEMTPREWMQMGMKNTSKPPIKHIECEQVVETTSLNSLQQGHRIGCGCHNNLAESNKWVNKYDDAVEMGKEGRFIVVTTREEWKRDCTSNRYCPELECMDCNEPVTTSSLNNLQKGHRIGCSCHNPHAEANLWVNRRPETVEMGQKDDYIVVTTPEEWKRDCTSNRYCPKFKCLKCNQPVESTSLASLQQGRGIGCGCRNKTEAKVAEWLRNRFPEAIVKTGFPGPGATHFDIHLLFPDGVELIVEVDGAQHFWENAYHFKLDGCERDLQKEKWSVDAQRNISIIRLIQEDAWNDRNGWEAFLMRSIDAARMVERARVFHPDAQEYTSKNSVYFQLRDKDCE